MMKRQDKKFIWTRCERFWDFLIIINASFFIRFDQTFAWVAASQRTRAVVLARLASLSVRDEG